MPAAKTASTGADKEVTREGVEKSAAEKGAKAAPVKAEGKAEGATGGTGKLGPAGDGAGPAVSSSAGGKASPPRDGLPFSPR